MTGPWRLLLDGPCEGAWNMAVDEALLQVAIEGEGRPTLRLYWWRPDTLSLGANQRVEGALDTAALEADGCGLVRRPTGGRAILHAEELTYSVTAPAPGGGTLAAYRWLAGGLRSGLSRVGVEVDLERMPNPASKRLDTRYPCFAAAGRYELVSGGRKVVGSAQRRRRGWLMQHGSILVGPRHLRLLRYLPAADPEAGVRALEAATTDCSALLGRRVTPEEMAVPFAEGFAEGLGIGLEPATLTARERERSALLRERRFACREWTLYGRIPGTVETVETVETGGTGGAGDLARPAVEAR